MERTAKETEVAVAVVKNAIEMVQRKRDVYDSVPTEDRRAALISGLGPFSLDVAIADVIVCVVRDVQRRVFDGIIDDLRALLAALEK